MEDKLDCGRLIKQIHDEIQKTVNNALRSQDMTLAQLEALLELDQAPENQLSLKELERRLHIAQSTTAGIIMRLEQKGFVEGFGDSGDRRIKLVRLTPAGADCLILAQESRTEIEGKLLSGLTETERHIFFTLLKKVRNTL
ncbi:MAG: MarR family transcriptional regulator [Oscillibacter sp.]|nr:MarR family transcriptional regulator [Oscillibacter sp.]